MDCSEDNWRSFWTRGDVDSLQRLVDNRLLQIKDMFMWRDGNSFTHVILQDILSRESRHHVVTFFLKNRLDLNFVQTAGGGVALWPLILKKATLETVRVFVEYIYCNGKQLFDVYPQALATTACRSDTLLIFQYLLDNLCARDLEKMMTYSNTLSRYLILSVYDMPGLEGVVSPHSLSYFDCLHRLKMWISALKFPDLPGMHFLCSVTNYSVYQAFIDVFVDAGTPLEAGLRAAASTNEWEIAADLVHRGADVNVDLDHSSGNSILARAIIHNAPMEFISAMLHAGADVFHQNVKGKTPVDIVQSGLVDPPISDLVLSFIGGQSTKAAAAAAAAFDE